MIVYWWASRGCITLAASLRVGRRRISSGRCLWLAPSQPGPKRKSVGPATVLAKPVDNVITPVKNWSLPKDSVVLKPPSVPPSETNSVDWTPEYAEWKKLPSLYLKLSKYKLSALVVLTTLSGAAMLQFHLMLLCSSGHHLVQDCALPQQTPSTSPTHGFTFGMVSGLLGISLLLTQVNALTAAIGTCNILLYALVYTPLKRISIVNTWIGSIVGSLPPLMGWTACTGSIGSGGLLMAAILYAWQFPHFNSLKLEPPW